MMEGFSRACLIGGSAVVLVALWTPNGALAQMPSVDRIGAIEQHIRRLEGELQALKRELGSTRKQLRQSRSDAEAARASTYLADPPAPMETQAAVAATPSPGAPSTPEPHVVQTTNNRFGLESADKRNSIYLTGRLHLDVADYLDYRPGSKFATVQNLGSGVNARRARLGVTGKFAGDWNYTLTYDFGGSSDGLPPTPGAPASGLHNAYVTYNGLNKGPAPLVFDLGYMEAPFGLDELTSSNDILFLERPAIINVATGIFANDSRSTFGARSNDDRYWAGAYVTGPSTGATHHTGQQMGAFGRAAYQVLHDPDYSLHLGGDVGALIKPPTTTVGGITNVAAITLADRPELRVDPTAILSTGTLGTAVNPLTGSLVWGIEGAAVWRNVFLQGEYYHIDLDRRGLTSNAFDGGYIEGSWTLTGERRKYLPVLGVYSGITPDHPFEPWADNYGAGAWELAFRYSTINLNSNFTPEAVAGPTSNAVGGGTQSVYAVGLNWYLNSNIRIMLDYLHGSINKRFSSNAGGGIAATPLGTPIGGTFDAVAMRTQFAF